MKKTYSIPRSHKTWKWLIALSSRGDKTSYGTSRCAYLLFSEVLNLKGEKVIELGTGAGWSAEAFLLALELTGGRLWSVDIRPRKATLNKLDKMGFRNRYSFYQGDSLDFAEKWDKGKADIVFIDTSHRYRQTLKELDAYSPIVNNNGTIFLHDALSHITYKTSEKTYGVLKAVKRWLRYNKGWSFYLYYTPYGLGKLKKK